MAITTPNTTETINLIKSLDMTKDNFDEMKRYLISKLKKIDELNEMLNKQSTKLTGIDRNFQEDMINDMDMGQ